MIPDALRDHVPLGVKSSAPAAAKRQAHGMTNSIPTGGTTGGAGRHAAALARVLPAVGGMDTVQRLAGLSGSDFTSVMLEVARLRYVQLALTPLSEVGEQIAAAVTGDLSGGQDRGTAAVIVLDHTRSAGRGYYRDLCFKVNARTGGPFQDKHQDKLHEIGDGGFTDWTQQLVASSKERLLISGIGVDRLAAVGPP